MKITRSSKCSLKFVTPGKKRKLDIVLAEYGRVVNIFIDHFWINGNISKSELLKSVVDIPKTWLSFRLRQLAAKESLGMIKSVQNVLKVNEEQLKQSIGVIQAKIMRVKSTTKKSRQNINNWYKSIKRYQNKLRDLHPTKPVHKGKRMCVSANIAELQQPKRAISFDTWLHLFSIGNKMGLNLPIKFHKHFNGLLGSYNKINSYIITRDYVQFAFERETGPKRTVRHLVGVDSGINALASLSNGEQLGTDIKEYVERIKRCKWGSKGHQRVQRALKQRIDETAKQVVSQPYELIVVEKLKGLSKLTKVTRRVTKNIRRSIGSWNYRYWLMRLEQQCEAGRTSFRTVSPAYTSQKCSKCGYTSGRNRHGEIFKCQKCESTGNAHTNAALNILDRFLTGKYGSCYKPL